MATPRKTSRARPRANLDDVEALARTHAAEAMAELARLAGAADSETVRLAAIKELLARAFGKSPQDVSPIEQVIRWARTAEESTPDPAKADLAKADLAKPDPLERTM